MNNDEPSPSETERLHKENGTLNAECERLEAENERLTQLQKRLQAQLDAAEAQNSSLQQQLAATQRQLAASAADTEGMVPIGEHWFAPGSIRALTWDRPKPYELTLCVDGVPVWRPPAEPQSLAGVAVRDTEDQAVQRKQDQRVWEAQRQAKAQEILATINRAKAALAGRRRQDEETP